RDLGLPLVAGQRHLAGIDDDDEVTGVDVRRERRLVLATQEVGGVAGQPAEHDVGRVDDVPPTLDLTRLRAVRTHRLTLSVDLGAAQAAKNRGKVPAYRAGTLVDFTQQPSTIPGRGHQGQNRVGPASAGAVSRS